MTKPPSDAAAMWHQRFASDEYIFGREPNVFLRAQAGQLPHCGHALCVADGEGRNSVWLVSRGLQVEALNIAKVGVAKARKLAADAGVPVAFHVAGCDEWQWAEDVYDAIVAVSVQFADPAIRERLFANMARALKPGGVLVLQGYTPKQLDYKTGGPGLLSHLYTTDPLRDAFASLQTIELVEYEAELTEGARHAGRSALIEFVARKP